MSLVGKRLKMKIGVIITFRILRIVELKVLSLKEVWHRVSDPNLSPSEIFPKGKAKVIGATGSGHLLLLKHTALPKGVLLQEHARVQTNCILWLVTKIKRTC
ncbi:hypothetical protein H5410_003544 [Solanum commersonii]|uniref:Uncharacterized protein n=1 Tax=Solanum commersonii TaxID=4109 RepID=A0A9J6B5D8_SOLCO|nr:hypothetical protein H5410_003544 [Solanum commersonii]